MKIKSFCTAKGMVTSLKRKPILWERNFANYVSDMD
jgi:hypothetical protein